MSYLISNSDLNIFSTDSRYVYVQPNVQQVNEPISITIDIPNYNIYRHRSPCDNCPNNPLVNRFATGICHCTLNLPEIR